MKARLTLFWAAIVAAGVTLAGVLTGRRRKARAQRQKARDQRRAKKAQRKAQGGGRRPGGPAMRSDPSTAGTQPAMTTPAPSVPPSAPAPPVPRSAPSPVEAATPQGDDLRAIKGLGAVAAEKLRGAGVTTYAQIAAWTPEEARDLALRLELQPGRIASDDWIGQARSLIDERAAD